MIYYFLESVADTSNGSSATDHSHSDDDQFPNSNNDKVSDVVPDDVMPEAMDIVPESNNSIPDALGCSEIQMDLSTIVDTMDDNAVDCYSGKSIIDQSVGIDLHVPGSEIELYDEMGNRITATLITIPSDDTTMENDSIYTIAPVCTKSSDKVL